MCMCVLFKKEEIKTHTFILSNQITLVCSEYLCISTFFLLELYLTVINSKYKTIFIAEMQQ